MQDKVTIALDVMGGDYAPDEMVKGAMAAVREDENIYIKLVGNKDQITPLLKEESKILDRIEIIHTTEVIETAENPIVAIRNKKDSSLVKTLKLVKDECADGMISAGNSGALLVGAQTIVGRIQGVERPALAPVMPTKEGPIILLDAGASMDAKSSWLNQWASLGTVYMEVMFGMKNPSVGIINVGAEEEKGNKLVKEAFPLLKENKTINFVGSLEARDVSFGEVKVAVCDAFVGNVVLKMYEGVAKMLLSEIKNAIKSTTVSKIGGLLIKKSIKNLLKTFDATAYGAAMLLGTKGIVMKAHGNSKEKQIKIGILQIATLVRRNIISKLEEKIQNTVLE